MSDETYFADIGFEGSKSLEILDYCFNPTTQAFLLSVGLSKAKTILDIGCGSGLISCWIAQQVPQAKVLAIDNNINQLNIANQQANKHNLKNICFKCCSAYEIETLNETFDFIYCRFLLHHLHQPDSVITKIFKFLNPQGIFASEEGIVNFSFSYPFSTAWGDEALHLPPVWENVKDTRDGNIGVKMFYKMHQAGFINLYTRIIHPILSTKHAKQRLLMGREELKNNVLQQGYTEAQWQEGEASLKQLINNDAQIIGFYASCQVAGKK